MRPRGSCTRVNWRLKVVKLVAAGVVAAFVVTGLGLAAGDAHAGRCSPGGGGGWGGWFGKGNNGFGNGGFDGVPGKSGNNKSPNSGQKRQDRVR